MKWLLIIFVSLRFGWVYAGRKRFKRETTAVASENTQHDRSDESQRQISAYNAQSTGHGHGMPPRFTWLAMLTTKVAIRSAAKKSAALLYPDMKLPRARRRHG
jgi:hypothetical protein